MKASAIIFWTCLATSLILIVVGFVLPPTGVVDGSVLTAVGELFGFATLGQLPTLIHHSRSVELHHGQTEIVVTQKDETDS